MFESFSRIVRPPPRLNVWQWADAHRFLAKGISARSLRASVPYRTLDAPHQKAPQESMTDPTVQVTVLIMASQIGGKTEMINNAIGYHMHWKPTNAVVMYPTIESGEKYSKQKLMPMVRATPVLQSLIAPARTRDSGNTILVKEFSGGSIFVVGSNSPASLRQASGQLLIADEIDSYEEGAGTEGDSIELLWRRGESFPGVVKILSSTPTVKGNSRIWKWFELSDQQYWHVPCPRCEFFQILKWANVVWPKGSPIDARYECCKCNKLLTDEERLFAYHAGRWHETAPFAGIRGFHLSGLYCPWPAQKGFANRLHQMAVEHLRAEKAGKESIRVRVNTFFCECFEDQLEEAPDASAIHTRCEVYPTEIPEEVCYLTAAADVQKNRIELEIVGWGIGEETWGIEYKAIFGKVDSPQLWAALDIELSKGFQHPCGAILKIGCALIDSGGTDDTKAFAHPVYRFVHQRQTRFVFACKGSSEPGAPLVRPSVQKATKIILQIVGTDVCKSAVYERLAIQSPGPGFMHYPRDRGYDEEYFAGLTAERVLMDRTKGSLKRKWIKQRERNEPLDIRAYNTAAFEIRRVNLVACSANLRKNMPTAPATEAKPLAACGSAAEIALKPPAAAQRPTNIRRRMKFAGWQ